MKKKSKSSNLDRSILVFYLTNSNFQIKKLIRKRSFSNSEHVMRLFWNFFETFLFVEFYKSFWFWWSGLCGCSSWSFSPGIFCMYGAYIQLGKNRWQPSRRRHQYETRQAKNRLVSYWWRRLEVPCVLSPGVFSHHPMSVFRYLLEICDTW